MVEFENKPFHNMLVDILLNDDLFRSYVIATLSCIILRRETFLHDL